VFTNKCYHQERHGACGSRNHSGTTASESCDDGNGKGSIEANFGVNAGNYRKGDGFGDESKSNNKSGEQVRAYV